MVVHVQAAYVKCPACNCAVDAHVLSISSVLGPPAVVCHWCGGVVATGRMEWWHMNWLGKSWFIGISVFYAALAFFLGGLSANTAFRFLTTGEWTNEWGITDPAFRVGGGAWAAVVALTQVYRIICSARRKKELELKPLRWSLLSFQVGGQLKFIILLLLLPAVCWVVGWIARLR